MNHLEKAISIAVKAHQGQTDKAGEPYILHPLRVMLNFQQEREMITAVLHDVVEDSRFTLDNLRNEGFPTEIVEAVDCLSKRPKEKFDKYILRLKKNPLAVRIKLADLEDNLNVRRLSEVGFKDWARINKYLEVWRDLQDNL